MLFLLAIHFLPSLLSIGLLQGQTRAGFFSQLNGKKVTLNYTEGLKTVI